MARSERQQIAHLLRRAGFGGNAALIDEYTALGFEGAVERLIHYDRIDNGELEATVARMRAENPESSNQQRPEYGNPQLEAAIWLTRMLLTKRPLEEKMTLFWHGHFTSSIQTVRFANLMYQQNNLFRVSALTTDFKALTKAVARDPAMLLYLDNVSNRKGKPNENWARELVELFTLGIGNYTENDVKEAARAFTGWTVDRRTNQFTFNARQHDTGQKTFLGVTGNLGGDNIIDIIFTQPVHAKFMARRLFRFLVYDDPTEATVNRLAKAYSQSNFSIKQLMAYILRGPEFRSDKAYYAVIKSPVEYTIGALRALSASFTDLRTWSGIHRSMAIMGQRVYEPPDVGGWPGGKSWINSTTYYTRANLADQLVAINSEATIDPGEIAAAAGVNTPEAAVNYFLELLLQSDVPAQYRSTLLTYMGRPANQRELNGKLRGLVRLIMSSPVYQMN